jgi:hypothetical protein
MFSMARAFVDPTFTAQIAILAATMTLFLSFAVAQQASKFGPAVAQRFLERGSEIPGVGPLNAANLSAWVGDERNAGFAHGYARRVIPMDIAFLLSFGTFLATAAMFIAATVRWRLLEAGSGWWWLLAILPALYVISDFIEDVFIIRLLETPSGIQSSFLFLRKVTSFKILMSAGAFAQLAILLVLLFALGSSKP